MSKIALIFFIGFELCYYLLIAQTGIVEYFASNIFVIAPLPIGGVLGSIIVYFLKIENGLKIKLFLSMQFLLTLFYPNFNSVGLFLLGISVGALAPLVINELKKTTYLELGLALSISYGVGTMLFNYDVGDRREIAFAFTAISLISSFFIVNMKEVKSNFSLESHSLFIMVLWIFLDSSLFETLSRDLNISIWRNGFTFEIIVFHILGLIAALKFKIPKVENELLVIILFSFSYLFYFLQESLLLSIVYPFVISYYNILILKSIIKLQLLQLAVYMVFIGWIASGAGLFVALGNLTLFVPLIFLVSFIKVLNLQQNQNLKEKECIN